MTISAKLFTYSDLLFQRVPFIMYKCILGKMATTHVFDGSIVLSIL